MSCPYHLFINKYPINKNIIRKTKPVPYKSIGFSTFSKTPPKITPAKTNFAISVNNSLAHC